LRFRFKGEERHDISQVEDLVAGYVFERLIADRPYDSDAFVQLLADQ